jgi:hypothetical protein
MKILEMIVVDDKITVNWVKWEKEIGYDLC